MENCAATKKNKFLFLFFPFKVSHVALAVSCLATKHPSPRRKITSALALFRCDECEYRSRKQTVVFIIVFYFFFIFGRMSWAHKETHALSGRFFVTKHDDNRRNKTRNTRHHSSSRDFHNTNTTTTNNNNNIDTANDGNGYYWISH